MWKVGHHHHHHYHHSHHHNHHHCHCCHNFENHYHLLHDHHDQHHHYHYHLYIDHHIIIVITIILILIIISKFITIHHHRPCCCEREMWCTCRTGLFTYIISYNNLEKAIEQVWFFPLQIPNIDIPNQLIGMPCMVTMMHCALIIITQQPEYQESLSNFSWQVVSSCGSLRGLVPSEYYYFYFPFQLAGRVELRQFTRPHVFQVLLFLFPVPAGRSCLVAAVYEASCLPKILHTQRGPAAAPVDSARKLSPFVFATWWGIRYVLHVIVVETTDWCMCPSVCFKLTKGKLPIL